MEKVEITVVGAGVVGLAVAVSLSESFRDVLVIERQESFGRETSSRNSEVIHAGIYYPKDSFKAVTCAEGKDLLYTFCTENNIAHKRIGKLIVANEPSEIKDLEDLFKCGVVNGVSDLGLIDESEIKRLEPNIRAKKAIYSPSTGILDTHGFMKALVGKIKENNGQVAYDTELTAIKPLRDRGFEVTVRDEKEGDFTFATRILVNCAGLDADKVAALAGLEREEYKIKYCKGDYFRAQPSKAKFLNHLVYPIPRKHDAGLGIHATLDLAGSLRLGPDDEYIDRICYDVDESKRKIFYESIRGFLPFIALEDISPDMAGVRPKLQGPDEDFRDFIIKDEADNALPGLINLIGIESPGFTSALSIAVRVREIAKKYY